MSAKQNNIISSLDWELIEQRRNKKKEARALRHIEGLTSDTISNLPWND